MSSQELIKYITRELVQYVDTPKTERLKKKAEKKLQKGSWMNHWFGMIPMAVKLLIKKD